MEPVFIPVQVLRTQDPVEKAASSGHQADEVCPDGAPGMLYGSRQGRCALRIPAFRT